MPVPNGVFVHVDVADGAPTSESLGVASLLADGGCTPTAVVLGPLSDEGAVDLAEHGCDAVIVDDHVAEAAPAAACAAAIVRLAGERDRGRWFASTSTVTTEAAAIAAARLDAGLQWRLTAVASDGDDVMATQVSADSAATRPVGWTTPWGLGLVRAHGLTPTRVAPGAEPTIERRVLADDADARVEIADRRSVAAGGGALAGADVIVAGGRGLGAPERLDLIRTLAERLGGTAGVSLPLVEAGWAPRSMQVGQTGTVVAPKVYIACGISGQIQHRVGMERSETIIAVNTDPNAPIMSFSDLAVVADAGALLPDLIAALERGVAP